MKKEFNITGTCYPHIHYMMNNERQITDVMELIGLGKYFTINRPRQFGKTTTLYFLVEALNKTDGYFPIHLNFQGVDTQWHESDKAFAQMFLNQLSRAMKYSAPELSSFLSKFDQVESKEMLSDIITDLMHKAAKKIVLLIDEVGASSNYTQKYHEKDWIS